MSDIQMQPNRILYMDSARSILMLLGVVLHAANIYTAGAYWIVSDTSQHVFFDKLAWEIHAFRMQAFFLISGFFCSMTLQKYGTPVFLQKRLPRVLVPIVSVWVLLVFPQIIFTNAHGLSNITLERLPVIDLWSQVYHLWFLFYVALYFLVAPVIAPLVHRAANLDTAFAAVGAGRKAGLFGLFALCYMLLFIGLSLAAHFYPVLYEDLAFFGSPFRIVYYFIFFLAGMVLKESTLLWAGFMRFGWGIWPVWWAASYLFTQVNPLALEGKLLKYTYEGALVFGYIHVVLFIFARFFDRPSKVWHYLSDASYSVYLLHHLVVILVGVWLLDAALIAPVKFLIVCVAGFGIPLLVHEYIILRVPLVRFLMNGRRS